MTGHRGLCSKRCVRCREQANWLDWEKPAGRGLTQEPIVEREDFPALVIQQLLRAPCPGTFILLHHSMPPVHTQLPLCHTLTHSFNHLNQRQWPAKTGNPSNLTDSQPHSHSYQTQVMNLWQQRNTTHSCCRSSRPRVSFPRRNQREAHNEPFALSRSPRSVFVGGPLSDFFYLWTF